MMAALFTEKQRELLEKYSMLCLLKEVARDIIMAFESAHANIWEARQTWQEILLEDAKKIEAIAAQRRKKGDKE